MVTIAKRKHYYVALETRKARADPVWWIQRNFYISETLEPIKFQPHQAAVLWYAFQRNPDGSPKFTTIVYSTPKKAGKTTTAAALVQWASETWGRFGHVLCVGNDATQARERVFSALRQSIELTPGYQPHRLVLPGRWVLKEMEARCIATGSKVQAVAMDYRGEAGANPTMTCWTELWGYTLQAATRFWAEMAPSPTRQTSIRLVETYAGYEGESELLYGLYRAATKDGRQLTTADLRATSRQWYVAADGPHRVMDGMYFEESPNDSDPVPCWVNEPAGLFVYWDSGDVAHRMPWQRGDQGRTYYAREASTQTALQFDRLHRNLWVSSEGAFIPIEQWDACKAPWPLQPGERTPMVVALDAAVSGDCFGMVAGCRASDDAQTVVVRMARKWDPAPGRPIDYSGPEEALRQFCKDWNVVQVAYDPYQLHDFATRLQRAGVAWFRPFSQGEERLKADKELYDLIMHRRIKHDGNPDLREHIANCNAKHSKDEDTRLRLVKKAENRKIDLAVCLSMMAKEVLRLNL